MRIAEKDYAKRYHDPDHVVPAIRGINMILSVATEETDEFTILVAKRYRSWVSKMYLKKTPYRMQGGICDEWLLDPHAFIDFITTEFTMRGIPFEDIRNTTFMRYDNDAPFSPTNFKIRRRYNTNADEDASAS